MSTALARLAEDLGPASLQEAAVNQMVLTDQPLKKIGQVAAPETDHLFAAHWSGIFNHGSGQKTEDYAILVWHRGGADVDGRFNPHGSTDIEAGSSTLTLQTAEHTVYWRSRGSLDFTHFYLPMADLAAQAELLFGDRRIVENLDVTTRRNPGIVRDLQRFSQLAETGPMSALELGGWRQMMAGQVLRAFGPGSTPSRTQSVKPLSKTDAQKIVDFMQAHIDEAITQEDLAAQLNISTFHFNRAFKQTTGLAPHQHLLSLRLTRAEDMLKNSNESLADIAYACGFSSQQHMTTTFSKHRGITPGRFRKMVSS